MEELIRKMEKLKVRVEGMTVNYLVHAIARNTAIDECINVVKEQLSNKSEDGK